MFRVQELLCLSRLKDNSILLGRSLDVNFKDLETIDKNYESTRNKLNSGQSQQHNLCGYFVFQFIGKSSESMEQGPMHSLPSRIDSYCYLKD